MQRSNSIRPAFTASNIVSSPTSEAPASFADAAADESGGHITAMRREVLTGWGSRKRFRTVGPFLRVRKRTARSYFADIGAWPTSNARIYLKGEMRDRSDSYSRR